MQVAVRPFVTTGVALVGASVIAVSPVAPPLPELPDVKLPAVSSAPVALTALVNPVEVFGEVLADVLANATSLAGEIANPGPILQLIATQAANLADPAAVFEFFTNLTDPAGLLTNMNELASVGIELLGNTLTQIAEVPAEQIPLAIEDLLNGEINSALTRIFQTIPNLILLGPGLGNIALIPQLTESLGELLPPARALLSTLGSAQFLVGVGLPLLGTVGTVVNSFGSAGDDLFAAVAAGDPEAIFNAVVTGTANIVNGVQTALLSTTAGLPAAVLGAIEALGQPTTSTAVSTNALSTAPAPDALPAGGTTVDVSIVDEGTETAKGTTGTASGDERGSGAAGPGSGASTDPDSARGAEAIKDGAAKEAEASKDADAGSTGGAADTGSNTGTATGSDTGSNTGTATVSDTGSVTGTDAKAGDSTSGNNSSDDNKSGDNSGDSN